MSKSSNKYVNMLEYAMPMEEPKIRIANPITSKHVIIIFFQLFGELNRCFEIIKPRTSARLFGLDYITAIATTVANIECHEYAFVI